jgi:chemotaxis-related protein WspD
MIEAPDATLDSTRATVSDCWNSIGVRGDSSCPELKQHVHCRNCPVYSAAAVDLLDVDLPADYMTHGTLQAAREEDLTQIDTHSVLIFRIGAEWLALPTMVLNEIVSPRAIHSIPHRRNGVVLGLTNIRGELLACFSLRQVLGLEQAADLEREQYRVSERLLVLQRDGNRAVCPVDEIYGIARFHHRDLMPAPATIAKAAASYTRSVLSWREKAVGLLDDQLLFHTVNRNLA